MSGGSKYVRDAIEHRFGVVHHESGDDQQVERPFHVKHSNRKLRSEHRCCVLHAPLLSVACSAAFRIYKGRAEVARRVGQLNWLAGPQRAPRRREAVHLPRGCRRGREISACGGVLLRQWRPPLCHLVESSALEVAGEEDGEDQEGRRLGQVPVEERRRATLRRV